MAADKVGDIDIVSILGDICSLLSLDPLRVDDVRTVLAFLPLSVAVEPVPGTDMPAFVRLVLPESSRLTLDTLQDPFGSYTELPRLHRQAPAEFIYYPDSGDAPYTCALIAETDSEQAAVQAVTIRRDIRLE